MRRAVITPTANDLGKDFENLVFIALRSTYSQVYYWKGRKEVDFVIETSEGLQPIQVSWDGIKDRHEEALEEFYREFKTTLNPVYITQDSFPTWARSLGD
jgi:predicted AAA+ superfamily ATPase